MSFPLRQLPVMQNWDCHVTGTCCKEYLVPISKEEKERLEAQGYTIEEAQGTVDAQTSGGSIRARLANQPRADSRLSTSGGGITISIAPNVSVDLDARTSGGDVDTDVPVTLLGRQSESSLEGKINGGGPKLVLRSSGGSIKLRKL